MTILHPRDKIMRKDAGCAGNKITVNAKTINRLRVVTKMKLCEKLNAVVST